MTETELLMQGLREAGCAENVAARICSLYDAGEDAELLHQMKSQRCALVEEMHRSQKKVDQMDYLIRKQEARMK